AGVFSLRFVMLDMMTAPLCFTGIHGPSGPPPSVRARWRDKNIEGRVDLPDLPGGPGVLNHFRELKDRSVRVAIVSPDQPIPVTIGQPHNASTVAAQPLAQTLG